VREKKFWGKINPFFSPPPTNNIAKAIEGIVDGAVEVGSIVEMAQHSHDRS
jgi:hypothetical protein